MRGRREGVSSFSSSPLMGEEKGGGDNGGKKEIPRQCSGH